ncbi:hypothetical protein G9A89_011332 [Geosiphon pyriformis]|nr:hypothetical protein G9A89_011332 [Geosiphon pyriformis]
MQVLNQFIKGLRSSFLRSIQPCHLANLQEAVIFTCDFESAEQEVNHTQAVNLAINRTSDIDTKITQLSKKLTQKIERFLAGSTETYQLLQQRENNNNSRYPQQQNYQQQQQPWRSDLHNCYYCQKPEHIVHDCRKKIMDQNQGNQYQQLRYQQSMNQLSQYAQQVSYTQPLSQNYYQPLLITQAISHYQTSPHSSFRPQVQTNSGPFRPISHAFYLGLMEDQSFDKSTPVKRENVEQISQPFKQTKSNIPPATITKDTTLTAIFPFNINNLNTHSLFSKAAINQDKPIMALYTDARVRGIDIKLILIDYATTAQIITVDGNTKTLIGEIDNFPFEINRIQIPIKNIQELQLTFNRQHARVPVTCRHFKTQHIEEPLIKFENTLLPPTIETYQVLWVDDYRIELPLPSIWEEKRKGRAKENYLLWVHVLETIKNGPLPPNTTANLVYWKDLDNQNDKTNKTTRHVLYRKNMQQGLLIHHINQQLALNRLNSYPHNDHKIWRMTNAKAENAIIGPNSKKTRAKYCNKCDLIFNLPPKILFSITELPEPKEKEALIIEDIIVSHISQPIQRTRAKIVQQSPIIIASHSFVKIDLKIALEISVSTMKGINVKGEIIDAGYIENIIMMLQNNLDRLYKIELQEKITQAIFLSLIKISQLTPVTTREELDLTARGINGFGSNRRRNVPVNFTKEDSNQIQDQALLFEASPKICSLANIANLYLPVKAHKHFKIYIHNLTEDVIKISKGTLVSSISVDIQNPEKLQSIPDFAQLFLFCDIISQHANVFASENEFGCTDIVKHQIDMGDARLIKQ